MKKALFIAALLGVSTLAGAASAAPYNPAFYNINQRQAQISQRIDQGVRTHDLTRNEAQRLRAQLIQIERLERYYRRGGLTRWERADLDRRLDMLSKAVFAERHDRQERPYRYGYNTYHR